MNLLTKQQKKILKEKCPCQSSENYQNCCYPIHEGQSPVTAEILMRSRFSAFALENFEYLIASWHSTTKPPEILKEDPPLQWIYLKIIKTEVENERGESFVTFEARYRENGKAGKFIEKSRFIKEDGFLKYLDGEFLDSVTA